MVLGTCSRVSIQAAKRITIRQITILFFLSFLMVCALASSADPASSEGSAIDRPPEWATEMAEAPGLTNFFKVSDDLYRGAQPEEEGFANLKKLGIKTVVNLRTLHSDRKDTANVGLKYVHIKVQAWEGEDDEVIEFLQVVTDPENHPVFLHCQHGADRTGVMTAVYRMAIQGWSKEKSIREMTEGGYGFHSVWQNLIDYVEDLDIDQVKARAGLGSAPQ